MDLLQRAVKVMQEQLNDRTAAREMACHIADEMNAIIREAAQQSVQRTAIACEECGKPAVVGLCAEHGDH